MTHKPSCYLNSHPHCSTLSDGCDTMYQLCCWNLTATSKLWSPQDAGSTGRKDLTGEGHGLGKWSSLVKLTPTTHMAVPESGTRRKCPGGADLPVKVCLGREGCLSGFYRLKSMRWGAFTWPPLLHGDPDSPCAESYTFGATPV